MAVPLSRFCLISTVYLSKERLIFLLKASFLSFMKSTSSLKERESNMCVRKGQIAQDSLKVSRCVMLQQFEPK